MPTERLQQSQLTPAEEKWIAELQAVIDKCPSKRIAGFTIGDPRISLYDASKNEQIYAIQEAGSDIEFGNAVEEANASLASIRCPFQIHSVAG